MKPYLIRLVLACWFIGMVALAVWGTPAQGQGVQQKYLPLMVRNRTLIQNPPLAQYFGIFIVYENNKAEIYSMRADGSDRKQLTHNNVQDSNVQWSPDNRFITFLQEVTPERTQLMLMHLDGSHKTILWQDESATALWHEWSPDSQQIVVMLQSLETGETDLWVFTPANGAAVKVVANILTETSSTRWSYDSHYLYYERATETGRTLWVSDYTGSSHWLITSALGDEVRWHPYRTKIVFDERNAEGYDYKHIALPDGSERRPVPYYILGWFPDGEHIVVERYPGMYIYAISSGEQRLLREGGVATPGLDALAPGYLYSNPGTSDNADPKLYLQSYRDSTVLTFEGVNCRWWDDTCTILEASWASDYKGFLYSEQKVIFTSTRYTTYYVSLQDPTQTPVEISQAYTNTSLQYLPFSSTWAIAQGHYSGYPGPSHDQMYILDSAAASTLSLGPGYSVVWRYLP